MRFGPAPCSLMAMSLMVRTMAVTSSRTPGIEENSRSTPSICTDCTAAPCSEDNRMRRSALPSVTPKPRSSGSATTVASRLGSAPAANWSLFGRISSCQFFWIVTLAPMPLCGAAAGGARARDLDFEGAHAVLLCLLGGVLGRHLRCVGRRFSRALEAHGAGRRPGDGVSLRVRNGDHGVIEGRVHVRDSGSDILVLAF